jgi:hypothetical protein
MHNADCVRACFQEIREITDIQDFRELDGSPDAVGGDRLFEANQAV